MSTIQFVSLFALVLSNSITMYNQMKFNPIGMNFVFNKIGVYGAFAVNTLTITFQFWLFSIYLGWDVFLIISSILGLVAQEYLFKQYTFKNADKAFDFLNSP